MSSRLCHFYITSPANGSIIPTGSVFTISADASDLYGRVRSVLFIRNGSFNLGSATNAPYSVNVTNLAATNYVLTVRVTDTTGLQNVSPPVNITVVAPIPIQLQSPNSSGASFTFDYTANPGLTYVIEGSAADGSPTPFVPLATNVANTSLVRFTDPDIASRSNRVYRVFRQP